MWIGGLLAPLTVTVCVAGFLKAGGYDFERMGFDAGKRVWPDNSARPWVADVKRDAAEAETKAEAREQKAAAIKREAERAKCYRKVAQSIEDSRIQYKKADEAWKDCVALAKYPPDNWMPPELKCNQQEMLRMAVKAGLQSLEMGDCP